MTNPPSARARTARASAQRSPPQGKPGGAKAGGGSAAHAAGTVPRPAIWAIAGVLLTAWLAIVWGPHRIGDYWAESDFYGGYVEGARAILRGQLDPSRYSVVGPVYEIVLAA